jgi:hypothetical protein
VLYRTAFDSESCTQQLLLTVKNQGETAAMYERP